MSNGKAWDGLPFSIIMAVIFLVVFLISLLVLRDRPDLYNWIWFFGGAAAGCASIPTLMKILGR